MKKVLICVIALTMLILCGCSVEETAKLVEQDKGDEVLCLSYEPRMFDSEEAFIAAIHEDKKAEAVSGYSLNNLDYYFVPEQIPEGMSLLQIDVRDTYVALRYTNDGKEDPNGENTFILEWYRTKISGDTKRNMESIYANRYTEYKGYYIVKVKPWDGYKGEKPFINQNIYWEQGDYAFHAVVPTEFTKEDIETYFVAKKIIIQ